MKDGLLQVRDLCITLPTPAGQVAAVQNISFTLARGDVLGLVGESGCGKSLTALSIIGLLPPAARILGRIRLRDLELSSLPERRLRSVRGGRIGFMFQDPLSSLNPVISIGSQIIETVQRHTPMPRADAQARAKALLAMTRLPDPSQIMASYPHQLSGGMRQRVLLAIALAATPELLIADEPTTALDVTVQAQILSLLADLRAQFGLALLLITHDLGVVAQNCTDVLVMYAGQAAEHAPVHTLFATPAHPYTIGLMNARPRLGTHTRLADIPGVVPPLSAMPGGCRFAPRCARADTRCATEAPPMRALSPGHHVACWHPHHD